MSINTTRLEKKILLKKVIHKYVKLIEIAKELAKECDKSYVDILKELFKAFWQGHFDREAYLLSDNAKRPKNKKEAERNGWKINRESLLIQGAIINDQMPDALKDPNISLEEKYRVMAALTPDEYENSLITMKRILVPLVILGEWIGDNDVNSFLKQQTTLNKTEQNKDFSIRDALGRTIKEIAQPYYDKGKQITGEELLNGLQRKLSATRKKAKSKADVCLNSCA